MIISRNGLKSEKLFRPDIVETVFGRMLLRIVANVLASATAAASLPSLNWITSSEKSANFGGIRTSSRHRRECWEMPFCPFWRLTQDFFDEWIAGNMPEGGRSGFGMK